MVFPWLMGQFFESIGPLAIMYIMAGDLIMAMLIYAILIRISDPIIPTDHGTNVRKRHPMFSI
jgi:hypothetical protein